MVINYNTEDGSDYDETMSKVISASVRSTEENLDDWMNRSKCTSTDQVSIKVITSKVVLRDQQKRN